MEAKVKGTKDKPKGEGDETGKETKRTRRMKRKFLANSSIREMVIVNGGTTADIAMRRGKEERGNLHSSCQKKIKSPGRKSLRW
jgi:hypothetical protein